MPRSIAKCPGCQRQYVRELREAKDAGAERKFVNAMSLKMPELETALQRISEQTMPSVEVHEVRFFGSQLALLAQIASERHGDMQLANDLMSVFEECVVASNNAQLAHQIRIGMSRPPASQTKEWEPGEYWAVRVEAYFWPSDQVYENLKTLFAQKAWAFRRFASTGSGTSFSRGTRTINGERVELGHELPTYSPAVQFTVHSAGGPEPILKKFKPHRVRKVDHGAHRITVVIDQMTD